VEPKRFLGVSVNLAYRFFGGLASSLCERLRVDDLLYRSGLKISPQGYFSILLFFFFFLFLPLSLVFLFFSLFLVFGSFFLLVSLAPLSLSFSLFLLFPYLKLSLRKSSLLSELPFASAYFGMLGLSGAPIYRGFETFSSQSVFPGMRREGELFLRDYLFFTKDPAVTLHDLSLTHPLKEFRDYLSSYLRIAESGGDVSSFLVDYTSRLGERLWSRFKRYSEDAKVFGDLLIALFVFIPLGVFSIFSVMSPIGAPFLFRIYGFVLTPILSFCLLIVIDSSQLKFPVNTSKYLKSSLFFMMPALLLSLFFMEYFGLRFYEVFSFFVTCSLMPSSIAYEFDKVRGRRLESRLPSFVRDVSEYVKIGLSVERALVLAEKRSYGDKLDGLIRRLNRSLRYSVVSVDDLFSSLTYGLKSWFARAFFWLFKESISTGGGPEIFSYLAKFSDEYFYFKRNVARESRLYVFIGYFASLMLLFVIVQVIRFGVLPQVSFHDFGEMSFSSTFSLSGDVVDELVDSAYSMISIISFFIGLIVGKVAHGSVVGGFKHAILCTLISFLGIRGVISLW